MSESKEYKTGFPDRKGWYDCLVDGIPIKLLNNYCELTRKHKWVDETGGLVTDEVKWKPNN